MVEAIAECEAIRDTYQMLLDRQAQRDRIDKWIRRIVLILAGLNVAGCVYWVVTLC